MSRDWLHALRIDRFWRSIPLLTLVAAFIHVVAPAHALSVADNCVSPSPSSKRRIFYVDPGQGSMSNDGSVARPWRTLAEVLTGKKGVVGPGDVIFLNSGDHGHVQLSDAVNRDFITIQAAPGQTPLVRSLKIINASKWMFVGLKFQGGLDQPNTPSAGTALIEFGRNQQKGPTTNIIFTGNSISTADDTSSWADSDWVNKPFMFGLFSSGTCISVVGNHFLNLRNAIQFDGERHLIADNRIENFGADAIDVVAGNSTIRNNRITGGKHTKADPLHPDGIQGWTRPGVTNSNVTIDGNIIIKTGDPKLSEMQGIGIYDGKWDRLTISNNVVVTNHWNGIAVGGISNARIVNNTLVSYDPNNRPVWIRVSNAKDGTPSKNVIVRNNITTRLMLPEEGVTADHNLVSKMISTVVAGKAVYLSKPGLYERNTIDPDIYDSLLNVDNSKGIYDLRLKPNSPAAGSGNAELAPAIDIAGKRRAVPVDIGAYAR